METTNCLVLSIGRESTYWPETDTNQIAYDVIFIPEIHMATKKQRVFIVAGNWSRNFLIRSKKD